MKVGGLVFMGGRDLRKELTLQIEGTAGRPACFRTVSRGWEGAGLWAVGSRTGSGWKPWTGPEHRSDVV